MPHAKRSSAGKMHGGRPRNSLRSNSLVRLSAVCIKPALSPHGSRGPGHMPHPSLPYSLPFELLIKKFLESMPFEVNQIQLGLLDSAPVDIGWVAFLLCQPFDPFSQGTPRLFEGQNL